MEQKTVINLEFAKGEERIAAAVMALVADARDAEPRPMGGNRRNEPEKTETDKNEERRTSDENRSTRSRREEPEDEERRMSNRASREESENDPDPENKEYTEIQLRDTPSPKLVSILKDQFGVEPNDYPGVNTNKKLRNLILDAQAGKLEDPVTEDTPDDERRPERGNRQDNVTHDDIRDLMADVIDADETNRSKVLKQLSKIGAKSVGTIKDEDVADFFEFLQSLKED